MTVAYKYYSSLHNAVHLLTQTRSQDDEKDFICPKKHNMSGIQPPGHV